MIPQYHRPATLAAAVQLKAELGAGAAFLAGGTEVNNLHAPRPTALIDLAGLGLAGLRFAPDGAHIGATVTFQALIDHPDTPWFLKAAARQMTNRNIRNQATVGGQLGANRSCGDLIPALLAAAARVVLVDRELPLEAYLANPSGLIVSVYVPATTRGFGLTNQTRTASDVSIINAAVSLALADGRVHAPVVAVGGVARHVVRLPAVEAALDGAPVPPATAVEALIAAAVHPKDDLRGSAAYKRHLAAVLGARAFAASVHCAEGRGATAGGGC